jgi:hypothetical protein
MADIRPRNILVIVSDQHHPGVVGYRGHPHVQTPHLDRLASEGFHFTRAYCASPICVPSRMSLITGQYFHRKRVCRDQAGCLSPGENPYRHAILRSPNTMRSFCATIGFSSPTGGGNILGTAMAQLRPCSIFRPIPGKCMTFPETLIAPVCSGPAANACSPSVIPKWRVAGQNSSKG